MVKTFSHTQIKRPASEVFEFITDPAKALMWHLEILKIDGLKGMPAGSVGTMGTVVIGRRVTSRYGVVENDGVSFTRTRSAQGPLRFETEQRVVSSGGSVTVSIQTRIDAGTIFRLAEP